MFYKKQGMPEEGEIVLCNVTKVLIHSVFVNIEEYGKTGMIHISEISPGRIRNIADFVKEGKKIVCKVLRIDMQKGHIDLSLRRVNEGQRRDKLNDLKKEARAEKIVENLSREIKIKPDALYKEITKNVFGSYEYLHQIFEEIALGETDVSALKLDKNLEEKLGKLIMERMAPSKFMLKGKIKLTTYDSNGLEKIKKFFKEIINENIAVKYLGGGSYNLEIVSSDAEQSEKSFEHIEKEIEKFNEREGEASIAKAE